MAGQLLVKFTQSAPPNDVEHAKAVADVELDKKVGGGGVRLLRSRSKDAETLVRELSARPDVVYAEPNYIIRAAAVPNDPRFGEQWALQNTGYTTATGAGTPGADVGVVSAWDVSTGSRDTVVAVVDTGVDYNHPDLAPNVWSAPAPFTVDIGGQAITCAAGTHGFDALTNTCDPMDDHNHGTHVAGIVGAAGNNSVGVSGVSQTASIMGLRFLDAQGNGTLEGAINAIEFAIQAKKFFGAGANVRVLSNSWGWAGEASQALRDQIERAAASDMLFVAGAGNDAADTDAAPFYPASYDAASVVSVAATDGDDALARASSWGSNYGRTSVDLAAPGNLILSTVIGGSYDWFSGTSMATPHVSGAAALVLSRCTLDTAGLKNILLRNVDLVASLAGVTATGGRLNVGKALSSCAGATPTPTPTPGPVNHALASNGGAAAASSSHNSNYPAASVINGDRRGLNWNAGGGWNDATPNAHPDWVEVSFAGPRSVDEVSVFTLQDSPGAPAEPTEAMTFSSYGVTAFRVQYWDGAGWADVAGGSVAGNDRVWRKFTFPAVTTSKVRVTVTAALAGYSRLTEVEAWGAAAAAPPAGVNHALASNGATARASSAHNSDYPAASVIDGDRRGLNWNSGGGWNDATPNSHPDWVEVAFAGAKSLTEVSVFTLQDGPARTRIRPGKRPFPPTPSHFR